jgi:hypothetical protein
VDPRQVKVLIQTGEEVETLWADPVGPALYRLDNTPFWAYGISWQDIVEARPDSAGVLRFVRVAEKSGHRTVRVILTPGIAESPAQRALIDAVVAMGCSFEGCNPRYITVDLPPGVELNRVAAYLTAHGVQWEHADPTYDMLYGGG